MGWEITAFSMSALMGLMSFIACDNGQRPAPALVAPITPPGVTVSVLPSASVITGLQPPALTAQLVQQEQGPVGQFALLSEQIRHRWDMGEIETAARKEGTLTVYTPATPAVPKTQAAISAHFAKKYGVDVQWTTLTPRDVVLRVRTELRTKQQIVDLVMYGTSVVYFPVQKPAGNFVPILAPSTLEPNVWRFDPASLFPEERGWLWMMFAASPSLLVNTSLVPVREEPSSLQELLQPKWKGKIIYQKPGIPGSGSGWFACFYRVMGLDYMRALAKQVVLVNNLNDVPDGVARGQYAIGLAPASERSRELVRQGAPVKLVYPKEGSYESSLGISILATAPHPNAAKLFAHWFYTKEGQSIYAPNNLVISIRNDVPFDYLPPNAADIVNYPIQRRTPEDQMPARTQELLDLASQIFEEGK